MSQTNNKIEISLTDFVDFVSKSGSPKLTKVKEVKNRDEYSPATDFYKAFREGVIKIHKANGDKKMLVDIQNNIKDVKKINNYLSTIEGYKKFWGRKKITWLDTLFTHWVVGDLDVRINPELGLEIDENFYIIKMYLKSDPLSKSKVEQILTLLESQLRPLTEKEVIFGVLDVKNSKLHCNSNKDINLISLLEGEARCFESIWKNN